MKKIIWPHGVVRILQISLIALFGYGYACAGIIVCALDIYSDWLLIFGIIFIFIAATITIFSFAKNKIILSSQEIVATGDGKKSYSLHEIVQYKVKIRYDEFSSITLEYRTTDTHNKALRHGAAQMPCILFHCKNGKIKIINIHTFSRKQRYFLLDWIIAKVKETQGLVLTEMTGEEFYKDFIRKDKEQALSRCKKN